MDEEANFARLLSEAAPAAKPSWGEEAADPWGNPFNDSTTAWGGEPQAPISPPRPSFDSYTAVPDPPSVIHAREKEELGFGDSGGFDADPYAGFGTPSRPTYSPKASSSTSPISPSTAHTAPISPPVDRHLPPGLIDEDLLAEHDPEASLKRAFVKRDSAPTTPAKADTTTTPSKKPYVFRPGKEAEKPKSATLKPPADTDPASIPLPHSSEATPTASRAATPVAPVAADPTSPVTAPTPADRVSVSPLETPNDGDFGFQSLAIGGSYANGSSQSPPNRFGGRGWGAVDDTGPLNGDAGASDPWNENGGGGWGEPGIQAAETPTSERDEPTQYSSGPSRARESTPGTPGRRSKLLNTPVFQITVSDPTKVGDPVRGHVVYTVRTKTTSPHYRRGEFSVLRRFSDFLWLFDALTANNPGVIVPPVPDKHAFGRFQEQFIETRRSALQRCLAKITAHPILQLDPDLRLFLESDTFSMDIKNRRGESSPVPSSGSGLLSSWTGPKYIEQDEWFDRRKAYLDHLEGHLKSLSKSLDTASKARLDMAAAVGDVADAANALAESDLGAAMCTALGKLANIAQQERSAGEDQARADVAQLLNLADEYVRFIASVRLAFASRIRAYHAWTAADKEVVRVRQAREKARQQGRLADRGTTSFADIGESERRARDAAADFEAQSKLVKNEFARFERERVEEFRRTLSAHLDGQISRQRELVTAWEDYHAMLLKMVQRAQVRVEQ